MEHSSRVLRARHFIDSHSVELIAMRPIEELKSWKNRILNPLALKKINEAMALSQTRQCFSHQSSDCRGENSDTFQATLPKQILLSGKKIVQVEILATGECESWTIHNHDSIPRRKVMNKGTVLAQLLLNAGLGDIINKPSGQRVRVTRKLALM